MQGGEGLWELTSSIRFHPIREDRWLQWHGHFTAAGFITNKLCDLRPDTALLQASAFSSIKGSVLVTPVSPDAKRCIECMPHARLLMFSARRLRLRCPSVGRAPCCLPSPVVTTASCRLLVSLGTSTKSFQFTS